VGHGRSIVIPVLNEGRRIGAQLAHVRALAGFDEIVVVDGGSVDDTTTVVRGTPGIQLVHAPRGRGPQLNAGAVAAGGEVVLFLHADVQLPADAAVWIHRALQDPAAVAGAFRIHTVNDGPPSWIDPFLPLADRRSRRTRYPYGDQAMFVRQAALARAGGVPDQPLMEDLELSYRLCRIGRIVTVPAVVTVSGRRFVQRPLRSVIQMQVLPRLYRLGVSPDRLARWYGAPR
jgi:rSAM/selenodomain-associated transferase 2